MRNHRVGGLAGMCLVALLVAGLYPAFLAAAEPSSAQLRTEIAEQEKQLTALRQRLQQAVEQRHTLELQEYRLVRQVSQLGENSVLQSRLANVRAKLRDARQAVARLEQERKAAEGRLASLKNTLRQQAADAARQREAASQAAEEQRAKEKAARQATKALRVQEAVEQSYLTVRPTPAYAQVKILNIGPRYRDGIPLTPGRYDIQVSAPGYQTDRRWHTLPAGRQDLAITLDAEPSAQRVKKAQRHEEEAAQQSTEAAEQLGTRGNKVDYSSMESTMQAAQQGDAKAQVALADRYRDGKGVPQDFTKATHWYRQAAEQGFAKAQENLGWMYSVGQGVPQDDAEAVRWYRQAAEQGFAKAQDSLGWMYSVGQGVPQDDAEAVRWYRKAAEQGFAWGQVHLGDMYLTGRGVPKDAAEAVRWYRKAAEQGHAGGQINLAMMYSLGKGVPQDDAEAIRWLREAAAQGKVEALFNLGFMYENGRGVAQNYVEAVRWYRKAAEQGHAGGQTRLGMMYRLGKGVPQDDAEAIRWFRKAAAKGEPDAMKILNDDAMKNLNRPTRNK